MPVQHRVLQGECLSSIAARYGFFPETIWDDPANADLVRLRRDPNLLSPDDSVVIPEKRVRGERIETGKRHVFTRKGVPARLRVRVMDGAAPRAGVPFLLDVDGRVQEGETDAEGLVECWIPPDAREGKLLVGPPEAREIYLLDLGHLDPVDTVAGVQARLNNLGFPCGEAGGELNGTTRAAIRAFQVYIGHPDPTGEMDDDTRQALAALHDDEA